MEFFHIGKLMFSKIPIDNSIPLYRHGESFRVGWMIGTVIMRINRWIIWWRRT